MKRRLFFIFLAILLLVCIGILAFLRINAHRETEKEHARLTVVSTLFPYYDFAKRIGGSEVHSILLLPPGSEAHHYDPSPEDFITLKKADLVFYTNPIMEPWMQTIERSVGNDRGFIELIQKNEFSLSNTHEEDHEEEDENDGHDHGGIDPHIWLDFSMAKMIAQRITEAFSKQDPKYKQTYENRLAQLIQELDRLDQEYGESLQACNQPILIQGGHMSLGYLAHRYHLAYYGPIGVQPDAEPSPSDIAEVIRIMRQASVSSVFQDVLDAPRYAEAIARETDAEILKIYTAHNVLKSDIEEDRSFIDIMKWNLSQLRKGLVCP